MVYLFTYLAFQSFLLWEHIMKIILEMCRAYYTRVIPQTSLVEQELQTLPEHQSSHSFFTCISEVRVIHVVKLNVFLCFFFVLWCTLRLTVTRRVLRVEQELLFLPKDMSSPPVFSGVRFARILVFCIVLCRSSSFCSFSFLPLYFLSFFHLRFLITSLLSSWFF